MGVVEGLLVDGNTLADGPDPADEETGHEELEDTASHGLAVAATSRVVGSENGADTGGQDVEDEDNGGDVSGDVGVSAS